MKEELPKPLHLPIGECLPDLFFFISNDLGMLKKSGGYFWVLPNDAWHDDGRKNSKERGWLSCSAHPWLTRRKSHFSPVKVKVPGVSRQASNHQLTMTQISLLGWQHQFDQVASSMWWRSSSKRAKDFAFDWQLWHTPGWRWGGIDQHYVQISPSKHKPSVLQSMDQVDQLYKGSTWQRSRARNFDV